MTQPIRPDELSALDGQGDPAELAAALGTARLIERTAGADGVRPTPGFSDRVMAAIAGEPLPRRNRLVALAGLFRLTWQTMLSANRPPMVRARALAIVLGALIALGSLGGAATLAAAGALNLFQAHPSSGPSQLPHPQVSPSPDPTQTHEPEHTSAPSETPEASESPEPTETAEPGDSPEPAASDHPRPSGGDGGGGGKATPRPSHTPEPVHTPEPSHSPEPTESPEPSD